LSEEGRTKRKEQDGKNLLEAMNLIKCRTELNLFKVDSVLWLQCNDTVATDQNPYHCFKTPPILNSRSNCCPNLSNSL